MLVNARVYLIVVVVFFTYLTFKFMRYIFAESLLRLMKWTKLHGRRSPP